MSTSWRYREVKICITGGSGFIGRYFCEQLLAQGHTLTNLDLIPPDWDDSDVEFFHGDVRDPDAVRAALAGCDVVIHLAAAHHDFGIEHDTYFAVNEGAARLLCEVMDEMQIRRAVFFSTVAVYGDAPEPNHEETVPEPNSPYGASKLAGEKVFQEWTEKGEGRRCLVIRPTVTFGPRNFANVYTLIDQIHRGRFVVVGKGTNIKCLSYVENTVDATFYLWEREDLPAFDVYNYITKPDLTSMEITKTVYEAFGKKMPWFRIPMWLALLAAVPFDIVIALTGKNLPISSARVKKMYSVQTNFESSKLLATGFQPRFDSREGLKKMVDWYLAGGKEESADWHQPPAEVVPFKG